MDTKDLDLNLLRSLDALLGAESVTGAARRIGISQPAMSAQLARLRQLFGDPLLVASGRRMVPTVRAEALRAPLRALLQDAEGLLREEVAFDPMAAEETFRLGGTDYVHAVLAGGLVDHLHRQAPGIRLAMMPFHSASVWQDLETGRLDAAIVTSFVTLNAAKARLLLRERFVFVQRRGHPRGSQPPDLNAFCALDHILVSPEGGGFVGAVDRALSALGRSRRVLVSLPSFLLAPALIQTSDLVCVFPERLALGCGGGLEVFPLPFALAGFDLQMVWHPRRHNDPAHVWFRNEIADYARRLPATPL
ncbi:LysR family transcriptional regulator [Pelagibius sp.]|uniref:LysR family transcriptional regulator n=1 Tax=Pelagibius sp. TaxID=1931238 RepID=UPI00260DAA40|nr:LysR family transcriptional regulator [Pelagibius sp.]